MLTPTPTATATIVEFDPLVMSMGPETRSVDDATDAIVEVRISLTPIAAPRPLPAETAIPPPIEMIDEPSTASTATEAGRVPAAAASVIVEDKIAASVSPKIRLIAIIPAPAMLDDDPRLTPADPAIEMIRGTGLPASSWGSRLAAVRRIPPPDVVVVDRSIVAWTRTGASAVPMRLRANPIPTPARPP